MLDSGTATAAPSVITRVRIGHGLAPRAAPIARAIARVSIGQAGTAPRSAAIALTITQGPHRSGPCRAARHDHCPDHRRGLNRSGPCHAGDRGTRPGPSEGSESVTTGMTGALGIGSALSGKDNAGQDGCRRQVQHQKPAA